MEKFKENLKKDLEGIKNLEDLKDFLSELLPKIFEAENLLAAQNHVLADAVSGLTSVMINESIGDDNGK